jgi:hypothetical protein
VASPEKTQGQAVNVQEVGSLEWNEPRWTVVTAAVDMCAEKLSSEKRGVELFNKFGERLSRRQQKRARGELVQCAALWHEGKCTVKY